MPTKPRSRCTSCRQLHDGTGKCPTCKAKADTRPSSSRRGYGAKHRRTFREAVLAKHPTCVICHRAPSTHADHYPHGRDELITMGLDPNDPAYGRGLCAHCDSTQTSRRQPGGFNARPGKI
jgi:5-methylcytosine-specific restriction protein A